MPPELDDGVSPTHFTYEFSPADILSQISLAMGNLPEIHIWNQLGDEIIDMSTRALQLHFHHSHINGQWKEPPPPRYLWGQPKAGTYYKPNLKAAKLALEVLSLIGINAGSEVIELEQRRFVHSPLGRYHKTH